MDNNKDIDASSDFSSEELKFVNFIAELIVSISIREASETQDQYGE